MSTVLLRKPFYRISELFTRWSVTESDIAARSEERSHLTSVFEHLVSYCLGNGDDEALVVEEGFGENVNVNDYFVVDFDVTVEVLGVVGH